MIYNGKNILESLQNVHWNVATRTYGNNHSTLIGLLVDWWISISPDTHSALEGGPTNGYKQKGKRGQCDALLCKDDAPLGVLEIEGTRPLSTIKKIGSFFNAKYYEIQTINFGIILLYSYNPVGKSSKRVFPDPMTTEVLKQAILITNKHKEKEFIVIKLGKKYQRISSGIRTKNEYYMGSPSLIEGLLFSNGKKIKKIQYYKN